MGMVGPLGFSVNTFNRQMSQVPRLSTAWRVWLALDTRFYHRTTPSSKSCIFQAAFLNGLLEVPIYIQNGRITHFLIYGPVLPYQ